MKNSKLKDTSIKIDGNDDEDQDVDFDSKTTEEMMKYDPLENNSVLFVCNTNDTVLMLLKNGMILTWGNNTTTIGRKLMITNESAIPTPIHLFEKVIELATGYDHVIARSINHKVFSWGKNSKGQLGHSAIEIGANNEKNEPMEIAFFSSIPIKQIFAGGDCSFAITEGGNSLFGWGDNEKGQIGFNPANKRLFNTPQLIPTTSQRKSAFIYMNRQGNKTYVAEISRPGNITSEAMEYFKNKMLIDEENELSSQVVLYEEREEMLKKRITLSSSSMTIAKKQILEGINNLITASQNKIQSLNRQLKSIDLQITKVKENITNNDIKVNEDNTNDIQRLTPEEAKQFELMGKLIDKTKDKAIKYRDRSLNEMNKIQVEKNQLITKLTLKKAQKKLLNEVKIMTTRMAETQEKDHNIQETKGALQLLEKHYENLSMTFFENYNELTPNCPSIATSIASATKMLSEIEEAVHKDVMIDESDKLGTETQSLFMNLLNISKQVSHV